MSNCRRKDDVVQLETPAELVGEIDPGILVTKKVPVPMPQTLTVKVLDRYEFDAMSHHSKNTLYLIRG